MGRWVGFKVQFLCVMQNAAFLKVTRGSGTIQQDKVAWVAGLAVEPTLFSVSVTLRCRAQGLHVVQLHMHHDVKLDK